MSLLSPPSPNDAIERLLKDASDGLGASYPGASECVAAGFRARVDGGGDDDSLSASDDEDDDDEAFFLATPLTIQEEKQSSLQQSKLRKLRDNPPLPGAASSHSFALSSILQASSTSLRGMNFVTSSTSLDKIGGKALSSSSCAYSHAMGSLRRPESSASIGLNLEGANGGPFSGGEESDDAMDVQVDPEDRAPPLPLGPPLLRATSSQTYMGPTMSASACHARDLVTPPIMAQPRSPPPLPAPRIATETEIARRSGSPPHAALSGLPARSPPPPPPPPPRSSHWPCSGQAGLSPMDLCIPTRILFTSTYPDGSPSG
jgi:hypothetical protein